MKLKLKIITPYGEYLNDEVDYLSVVASDGQLGILPGHTPLVAPLKISRLTIKKNGVNIDYAISGGVLLVEKDITRVLVNAIEAKDEIDLDRAIESKKRAEERLLKNFEIDVSRAQASLSRALNRINIKQN